MSQEEPIDFRAFVERHHKRSGRKPSTPAMIVYPPVWKSFCLDVLNAYREAEKDRLGLKKYGWQATRDAIMADFDEAAGRKIVGRDNRLTRDHLQDWERHGSIPDTAFRFVERFIRSLDRSLAHAHVTAAVRQTQFERLSHGLIEMYQNRSIDHGEVAFLAKSMGRFLVSPPLEKSTFRQMIIRQDAVLGSVIKITFAYSPFTVSRENPTDFKRAPGLFYDGFLIPLTDFQQPEEFEVFEFSKTRAGKDYPCLLLLFRPEYRGDYLFGYVVGLIEFVFTKLFFEELTLVGAKLVDPNLPFSPTGRPAILDPRFHHPRNPNASILDFENTQKHSDFLDNYFNSCYKGYLF